MVKIFEVAEDSGRYFIALEFHEDFLSEHILSRSSWVGTAALQQENSPPFPGTLPIGYSFSDTRPLLLADVLGS